VVQPAARGPLFSSRQSYSYIGSNYFVIKRVTFLFLPLSLFLYFAFGPPCLLHYTNWPVSHKRLDHTYLEDEQQARWLPQFKDVVSPHHHHHHHENVWGTGGTAVRIVKHSTAWRGAVELPRACHYIIRNMVKQLFLGQSLSGVCCFYAVFYISPNNHCH
jgi:hypothetical protein